MKTTTEDLKINQADFKKWKNDNAHLLKLIQPPREKMSTIEDLKKMIENEIATLKELDHLEYLFENLVTAYSSHDNFNSLPAGDKKFDYEHINVLRKIIYKVVEYSKYGEDVKH